ncbi:MAG: UDP-glucose 4-epimerase GalE, partial [Proteobacteria bacterium]|nr:UDP-glucose 4-epimerase GalE [Pseudomonadota bacterium]
MRILATGGAGYIGTHVVLDLLEAGHDVVVVDDFSTGERQALARAQEIAGQTCEIVASDIADGAVLREALQGVDAVIHFAAYKRVGESMERPEHYFRNNLGGMATLLSAMVDSGVDRIVYSSSAAVYGTQEVLPIPEAAAGRPDSPYGLTKLQGEQMLEWMADRRGWSATSLRYFNPVGAHASGHIGEPVANGANLFPRVLDAYADARKALTVFGTDYDTPDGTCLRDYIHVCDLSQGHLKALELTEPGHRAFNVGTGRPHSVREILDGFERHTGRRVPHTDGPRRAGDVPAAAADPSRFHQATGFEATR